MSLAALTQPVAAPSPLPPLDEPLYEIVDGQFVELPPMSTYAGILASKLVAKLDTFAEAHQSGQAVAEVLFGLDAAGRLRRRPDVAFVSYQRWPKDKPWPHSDPWLVVPNLAVEVVSPNDLAEELRTKVAEYFRAGVELVWVVYPRLSLVDVYESASRVRVLTRDQELDGGAVLPNFRLPLATLFAEPTSSDV